MDAGAGAERRNPFPAPPEDPGISMGPSPCPPFSREAFPLPPLDALGSFWMPLALGSRPLMPGSSFLPPPLSRVPRVSRAAWAFPVFPPLVPRACVCAPALRDLRSTPFHIPSFPKEIYKERVSPPFAFPLCSPSLRSVVVLASLRPPPFFPALAIARARMGNLLL